MQEEAIKRLSWLVEHGLENEALDKFKEGKPCVAKQMDVLGEITGVTFTFKELPELNKIKDECERKYNCQVYYGIYTETMYGNLLSMLYVHNSKKEKDGGLQALRRKCPLAYVYNINENIMELGEIGIEIANGGLFRIH